jgi:hypothetical protein
MRRAQAEFKSEIEAAGLALMTGHGVRLTR